MLAAAVLYVKDLDRMSAFYEAAFGLRVVDAATAHCVLVSPTLELSLVKMPPGLAARVQITSPPARRTETPIKLAFPVPSLGDAEPAVVRLGGQLDDASTEWEFRGARLRDGVDPEGNVFQLREARG